MATVSEARALLEAVDKTIAKVVRNARRQYVIEMEVAIKRYQHAMWRTVRSYEAKLSLSVGSSGHHKTVVHNMIVELERIGDMNLRQAANVGFERALADLVIRGWLVRYSHPVIAPREIAAASIKENARYLHESLLADLERDLDRVKDDTEVPKLLVKYRSRIFMYGHWMWRTAEAAYRDGSKMYFNFVQPHLKESMREGGVGSGNFGHAGRPGEVGGSADAPGGKWKTDNYTKDGKVELVPLTLLKQWQGNQIGKKTNIEELKQSIKERGLDEPIIIQFDHKNNLIMTGEGNHRVEALLQLGYKYAPARAMRGTIVADWKGVIPDHPFSFPPGLANSNGYVPGDIAPSKLGIPTRPLREGGAGSGNFGHAGRPGEVGGSTASSHIKEIVNKPSGDLKATERSTFVLTAASKELEATVVDEIHRNIEKIPGQVKEVDQVSFSRGLFSMETGLKGGYAGIVIAPWATSGKTIMSFNPDSGMSPSTWHAPAHEQAYTIPAKLSTDSESYARVVVDHEMGHVLYNHNPSMRINWDTKTYAKTPYNEIEKWSRYASVDSKEAFAEAYAAYVNKADMPPVYRDFFDANLHQHTLKEASTHDSVPVMYVCGFMTSPTYHVYKTHTVQLHAHETSEVAVDKFDLHPTRFIEGGPGSGNFGHAGRSGEVGGSSPSGAAKKDAGHQQTAANEPGVDPNGPAPWDLKAPASPRYPGDTSIYSPAVPDANGNFTLGRRLQGSKLNPPGDPNQVAMYTFIPARANTEQLSKYEGIIQANCDHAQLHPGTIAFKDSSGQLQKTEGNNYWIRGDYHDLIALHDTLTPQLAKDFGRDTYTTMMTDSVAGTKISAGSALDHIRVVVPFAAGTPKNTVGEASVGRVGRDKILLAMSGDEGRHVWEHADFNGLHLATSLPKGSADELMPRIVALGGAADKEQHHSVGATRFVSNNVNVERYPVRGLREDGRFMRDE